MKIEDNLIGYYRILGKDESEKVVQALGYDSWEDFCEKHGYEDCYDWIDSVEDEIMTEWRRMQSEYATE